MKIEFKKLSDTAIVPKRGSEEAAGWDLYSDITEDITIKPHTTEAIPTNIAVAIPNGYFGGVYARSGLAFRNGIRPSNAVGIIDADFRNGIMVGLYNDSDEPFTVTQNMRIAQLIIHKFEEIEFIEVETLDDTERGLNGFGSTGLQ